MGWLKDEIERARQRMLKVPPHARPVWNEAVKRERPDAVTDKRGQVLDFNPNAHAFGELPPEPPTGV